MADHANVAPDRYASLVAPAIERLTLAVVTLAIARATGTPAPPAAPPDSIRMLGQLRTALLARPVAAEGLAAIYRYRDPADIRRNLEALQTAALIETAADGTIRASERGRVILNQMYDVTAEVADELWSPHQASLVDLCDVAGRLVEIGLATGGVAYSTMAPPYEPPNASTALRLHTRLSALRYHRQDAHAAAWQAAGLTSAAIRLLPAGVARDAIEADTNRRDAAPYASLSSDERLTFLAGLAALPG